MNTNQPDKQIAIISGGTKGIGKSLVTAFAKLGYDIVTCSRNLNELEQLKQSIESEHPVTVYIQQADMSTKEDANSFGDFALSLELSIAVLINNSGVFLPGEIHTEDENAFEIQLSTNVHSAYYLSRRIIPLMKSQGYGHVFNVCSTASNTAYTNGGSYCISKFAMYGMTKVLRQELKPFNIRVTGVLPGATLTASWDGTELPEDRFMPPEDVATMIVAGFQLSSRSVVEDIVMRPLLGDL